MRKKRVNKYGCNNEVSDRKSWQYHCTRMEHAVKEENKFKGHDAVLDDLSKRFIINTDDTSDESENDDKENDEDAMSDVEEF